MSTTDCSNDGTAKMKYEIVKATEQRILEVK